MLHTHVAAVDTDALLELMWVAPLSVAAVTVAWAMVVQGSTRAAEARRDGRAGLAGLHALVAVVGGVLFTAAVVLGIVIMRSK